MQTIGIHWFRRDLRLNQNEALNYNLKINQGRVLGVFFFDKKFLKRDDFSVNRFDFFLNTLAELQKSMQARGGQLLVLEAQALEGLQKIINDLKHQSRYQLQVISYNRDYEPYARKRDTAIEKFFSQLTLPQLYSQRDHLIIEPHEIVRTGSEKLFYQIFTPFAKNWLNTLQTPALQNRLIAKSEKLKFNLTYADALGAAQLKRNDFYHDQLANYQKSNSKLLTIASIKAGEDVAQQQLKKFMTQIERYPLERDYPALTANCKLSHFLKNGSLTTTQIVQTLGLNQNQKFLNQIIWREFYYHILFHCPEVEDQAFLKKFQNIDWPNNELWFENWKQGLTGFPIVDAAMRELKTTGFMHNRMRMVVASFLTKDLLIDWRWGARYFMQTLYDGDLAANNGGWQWAASTGCDPQPYFRIFNPWLQSKKFDSNGDYIKKWLPELKNFSAQQLHNPKTNFKYAKPLVDHQQQSRKALALYQTTKP